MNLSTASRTYQLLTRIFDVRNATEPFLPSGAEKKPLPLREPQQPFPRATPESQGISSDHIRRFLEELGQGGDLFMQDVLILRHGQVLCGASYDSQILTAPKHTFSACKSVTALAIGLLIDDGILHLEDKVADLFEDLATAAVRRRFKNMSVEDLLTMRSGVLFSEPEALTETDWIKAFLNSSLKGEPGAEFHYNSLNTYMLSAIVCRKTGKGLLPFLEERLFGPMGITDVLWEKCPMGIEKGGWGLYIRPEDIAKLGQLVMDNGMWQGTRLISQEFIQAATTAHATPPPELGDFNYGYQIWVGRKANAFLFNGMLGQNVLGFRDSGILLVTNAGADTDYQESRYFEIVDRYFGGQFPDSLPEDPQATERLQKTVAALSSYIHPSLPLDAQAEPFLHHSFEVDDPKAASVGLLPVALQALHNNYTAGLTSIAVSVRGELPELIYREKNATYRLPVGLGRPQITQLDINGDVYQVAASGRFTHDEEERPVFYIKLAFLETPSIRTIKLILTPEGLLLRQTETPGVPYVFKKLRRAADTALYKPLLLLALGGTEEDYLRYKTLQLISPEISLRPISQNNCQ